MANDFLRTEEVAFDNLIAGFDDGLVIGKAADTYNIGSAQDQVNQGDKEWIPAPMISASGDGFSATFGGVTDLAVPVSDRKSVVSGKSVSVRVDPGGRRIITKKTQ